MRCVVFLLSRIVVFPTLTRLQQLIFKTGDDLRQDQLIIQMVTLMDRLLRKENLDLRLTPYKVLSTGLEEGMVQFVPSEPIAAVLADFNHSITAYLRKGSSDPSANSIPVNIMDNYIRSTGMTFVLSRIRKRIYKSNSRLLCHYIFAGHRRPPLGQHHVSP